MFNTSGPASPRHSLAISLSFLPFHFAASGDGAPSWGADVGGLPRPPPLPGSETPQFLSCVSLSLPVSFPARSLSLSLSLSRFAE